MGKAFFARGATCANRTEFKQKNALARRALIAAAAAIALSGCETLTETTGIQSAIEARQTNWNYGKQIRTFMSSSQKALNKFDPAKPATWPAMKEAVGFRTVLDEYKKERGSKKPGRNVVKAEERLTEITRRLQADVDKAYQAYNGRGFSEAYPKAGAAQPSAGLISQKVAAIEPNALETAYTGGQLERFEVPFAEQLISSRRLQPIKDNPQAPIVQRYALLRGLVELGVTRGLDQVALLPPVFLIGQTSERPERVAEITSGDIKRSVPLKASSISAAEFQYRQPLSRPGVVIARAQTPGRCVEGVPEMKGSRRAVGQRDVPNPKISQLQSQISTARSRTGGLQSDLQLARDDIYRKRQAVANAQRNANDPYKCQMENPWLAGGCRAALVALVVRAQSQLQSAENRANRIRRSIDDNNSSISRLSSELSRTPRTVKETIFESYQYAERRFDCERSERYRMVIRDFTGEAPVFFEMPGVTTAKFTLPRGVDQRDPNFNQILSRLDRAETVNGFLSGVVGPFPSGTDIVLSAVEGRGRVQPNGAPQAFLAFQTPASQPTSLTPAPIQTPEPAPRTDPATVFGAN